MASLSRIRLFEEVKQTWACFDDEAGRAVRAKAVGKVGLRLSSVRAIYTGLFFFYDATTNWRFVVEQK